MVDGTAAQYWRMLLTGDGAHALLGAAAAKWGAGFLLAERLSGGLVLALLLGGAVVAVRCLVRGRRGAAGGAALAAAVWAAMPLVAFTRHSTPVHIHYLAVAIPAGALLVGALVGAGGGRAQPGAAGLPRWARALSVAPSWRSGGATPGVGLPWQLRAARGARRFTLRRPPRAGR